MDTSALVASLEASTAVSVAFPDTLLESSLPCISLGDSATTSGGVILAQGEELTLGDVIDTINTAGAGKLTAALSASGDGIELTDNSGGAGAFSVSSPSGGELAEDLGLIDPAVGNVISGRRLSGGASGFPAVHQNEPITDTSGAYSFRSIRPSHRSHHDPSSVSPCQISRSEIRTSTTSRARLKSRSLMRIST